MQAADIAQAIAGVPWLEFIKTAAPAATAVIAFLALRNWQKQDRAKREAEFLDQIVDAVHLYIVEMQRPVELLRMAKIGMKSHVKIWEEGSEDEKKVSGAIEYIKNMENGMVNAFWKPFP
ncbi:hypothetical protein [Novosphingobium sp.]|uniref:hypothetical protein n=1 Tax=Novosphingobium sp. TaxID=1874826 RepID=UPI002732AB01|nr:hypothetical protein [Novosphingobium sp.]MDP3907587.1 hypothetical protein [Novosphingobium sp.]